MSCNKVSVVLCVKKKRASGSMLSFCLIHASLLRMGENFPIDLLWDHFTSLLLCTSMILHTGVSAISIFFQSITLSTLIPIPYKSSSRAAGKHLTLCLYQQLWNALYSTNTCKAETLTLCCNNCSICSISFLRI